MRARGANDALQQLDKVRSELSSAKDPLCDATHELRERFCSLIEDVLLRDLELGLTKKLEQDLWNVGYRSAITSIQKEEAGKERSTRLSQIMDLSTSYFLKLLQQIVLRYKVTELKVIPGPDAQGVLDFTEGPGQDEEIRITKRSRVLYICQYCLIHIGDISRYRNERRLAEAYYAQAVSIDPRNGHPYNQLGLIEGTRGEDLTSIFYYVRSLSVGRPFVVAISNLEKIFMKILQHESSETPESKKERLLIAQMVSLFLRLISSIHMKQRLPESEKILEEFLGLLPRVILNKNPNDADLLMMTTIALYTFDRCRREQKTGRDSSWESSMTIMSRLVFGLFRNLLLVNVEALNFSTHPSIWLLLEALLSNPTSIQLNPFPELWFILGTVLNSIELNASSEWRDQALPEDFRLQGFLPLCHSHSKVDFSCDTSLKDSEDIRQSRIHKLGVEICRLKGVSEAKLLSFRDSKFQMSSTSDEESLTDELNRMKIESEPRAAVRFEEAPGPERQDRPEVPKPAPTFRPTEVPFRMPMPFRHIPPPPLPIGRWSMMPPQIPPPPLMRHPRPPFPMPLEEMIKHPPPPVYNIDLRLVHSGGVQPPMRPPAPFPQAMPSQSNTYSLFNQGSTWNPPILHPPSMNRMPPVPNPVPQPFGNYVNPGGFQPARPQGGSLWKPDKAAGGTSALERLIKESRKNGKES